jgi:hypothetical protein
MTFASLNGEPSDQPSSCDQPSSWHHIYPRVAHGPIESLLADIDRRQKTDNAILFGCGIYNMKAGFSARVS